MKYQDEDERTAFHWAIVSDQQEVAELLISYGAKVNHADEDGIGFSLGDPSSSFESISS